MADARKPLSVGQFVRNEGKLCYIHDIQNYLGFNQYFLIDCDNGMCIKRSGYQLEPANNPVADDMAEGSGDKNINIVEGVEEKSEQKEKVTAKRFLNVSNEELDSTEINRTSYRTRKQTIWAVTILKGEFHE